MAQCDHVSCAAAHVLALKVLDYLENDEVLVSCIDLIATDLGSTAEEAAHFGLGMLMDALETSVAREAATEIDEEWDEFNDPDA